MRFVLASVQSKQFFLEIIVPENPIIEKTIGSMVAVGVGDALGWPFEGRSRRMQTQRFPDLHLHPEEFFSWTRSGSRSAPYREPINPGEYSDDTQLLLATARSLKRGREWAEYFAKVELPCWLLYERGGGGATKRAAQSWLIGTPPWTNEKGRAQYFEAGGNGVAMRILPHVLHSKGLHPTEVASQIVQNGITTHGHPRALIGALLHGLAVWLSIRQKEILEFGALIDSMFREFPRWASVRLLSESWLNHFSQSEADNYFRVWEDTVGEAIDLLKIAKDSLERGPLTVGPETLEKMGALSPKTNGSGTITAVASVFLASRYASSPRQGLTLAATTYGADTDTLASMAASILAAIHGIEWLGHLGSSVQDAGYLRKTGTELASNSFENRLEAFPRVSKKINSEFLSELKTVQKEKRIELPDGRFGIVKGIQEMFSQTAKAELCMVDTEDGQTLYFKRIARGQKSSKSGIDQESKAPKGEILKIGVKIYVADLRKAKDFYAGKLSLPIDKEFANGFTVAGIISCYLIERNGQGSFSLRSGGQSLVVPCIRVSSLSTMVNRLERNGVRFAHQNGGQSYKTIRVEDPFGNVLEIFEA